MCPALYDADLRVVVVFGFCARLSAAELLLQLCHPRLERVDAAHLLAEIVDPRPQVVERIERPRAAGQVRQAGERRLTLARPAG